MSEKCNFLHQWFNQLNKLHYPFDLNQIPLNGIYILFEKGEYAHNTDRIVRVGTHTGKNQLRSRLKQHFINENKDRSIFRKNIGRALLNQHHDSFLEQWNIDLTTRKAKDKYLQSFDVNRKSEIENQVSQIIQQNFSVVVFEVQDRDKRLELESKIISTISHCSECGASSNWLGNNSPKEKIRDNGLWLVNNLSKDQLSETDMEQIQKIFSIEQEYK